MAKKKKPVVKSRCVFEFYMSIEQASREAPKEHDKGFIFVDYCLKKGESHELGNMRVNLDPKTHHIDDDSMEKMREFAHQPDFEGYIKSIRFEEYIE